MRRSLPQRTGLRTKYLTLNMGTMVKKAMRGVRMKQPMKRRVEVEDKPVKSITWLKSKGRMKTPMKKSMKLIA